MTFGVEQEQDWNALEDDEFRGIISADFRENYPDHLRFPPYRMRWSELRDWYLRISGKGWLAPNWPAEFGGMGLEPRKALIFHEEVERGDPTFHVDLVDDDGVPFEPDRLAAVGRGNDRDVGDRPDDRQILDATMRITQRPQDDAAGEADERHLVLHVAQVAADDVP